MHSVKNLGDKSHAADVESRRTTSQNEDQDVEGEALIEEISSYITRLFLATDLIQEVAPADTFVESIKREQLALDEQRDIKQVCDTFPKLALDDHLWLRQRLGRAITQRRRFLREAEERREYADPKAKVTSDTFTARCITFG